MQSETNQTETDEAAAALERELRAYEAAGVYFARTEGIDLTAAVGVSLADLKRESTG